MRRATAVDDRDGVVARLRAARYLCESLAVGVGAAFVPPALLVATATVPLGVGLVLLPATLHGLRGLTAGERRRVAAFLGATIPPPRPRPAGRLGMRAVMGDRSTLRDLGWAFVQAGIGVPAGMIALFAVLGPAVAVVHTGFWWLAPDDRPATTLGLPVTSWTWAIGTGAAQFAVCAVLFWLVVPGLARAQARLSARLLSPSAARLLEERVGTLTTTRSDALAVHAGELRRIERDLHDGAQAQLVSLAIRLGVAERALADDPATAARLLGEARAGAEEAMAHLRDVARSIYPPILADRGIRGALSALAARCPVPARVRFGEIGELPPAVAAAVYFVVAEGLTNVAKHAGARSVEVRVAQTREHLRVEVVDDGAGGIDERRGTGVAGIRARVAALDGTVGVDSPAGGPSRIVVELPCGS